MPVIEHYEKIGKVALVGSKYLRLSLLLIEHDRSIVVQLRMRSTLQPSRR